MVLTVFYLPLKALMVFSMGAEVMASAPALSVGPLLALSAAVEDYPPAFSQLHRPRQSRESMWRASFQT
jgi:hypothetical protein